MQQRPKPQTEPVTAVPAVRCRVGGEMVQGCGPRQVVLPGLHEMVLAAQGWVPSAECVRWGRTAPALTSRRPAGVWPGGYDEVQSRRLKPGWNPVETACGGYASQSRVSSVRGARAALTCSAREVARPSSSIRIAARRQAAALAVS